jgi:hypothetical protein
MPIAAPLPDFGGSAAASQARAAGVNPLSTITVSAVKARIVPRIALDSDEE